MTTEEKAKAYDEALDRMKHVVIVPENEKALQALKETIFPELKESEDERIRKSIIHILQVGGYMSSEEKDKAFAYLEKQKINTEGDFGRGYDCGYEACLNSHGAEWFEKQKEQKPSEEDEKTIDDAYCWLCEYAGSLMQKNREKSSMLYGIADKLKSLPPQSKEELAKMLQDEYNKGRAAGKREGYTKGYDKGYKDANESVSYHFPVMPTTPSGWGCDGTHCTNPHMDCINCPVKSTGGMLNTTSNSGDLTLKADWKPSEEQMEALDNARFYKAYDRTELDSLYEQLKQLK